mmetsp:Transcript_23270/g.44315  ORF Transcript_23270/g.44315 Transcript_23270/m.44315 type:complete len:439 (+) Transcript_23270:218-1534(+)
MSRTRSRSSADDQNLSSPTSGVSGNYVLEALDSAGLWMRQNSSNGVDHQNEYSRSTGSQTPSTATPMHEPRLEPTMFSMADNFLTMDADSQANDIVSDKSDLHKVTREGDYVPNTAKERFLFTTSGPAPRGWEGLYNSNRLEGDDGMVDLPLHEQPAQTARASTSASLSAEIRMKRSPSVENPSELLNSKPQGGAVSSVLDFLAWPFPMPKATSLQGDPQPESPGSISTKTAVPELNMSFGEAAPSPVSAPAGSRRLSNLPSPHPIQPMYAQELGDYRRNQDVFTFRGASHGPGFRGESTSPKGMRKDTPSIMGAADTQIHNIRCELDATQSALTTHKVELALARRELVEEEQVKRAAQEDVERRSVQIETLKASLHDLRQKYQQEKAQKEDLSDLLAAARTRILVQGTLHTVLVAMIGTIVGTVWLLYTNKNMCLMK